MTFPRKLQEQREARAAHSARTIPIVSAEQWAGELCARCSEPGHCCKLFNLSTADGPWVAWDDERPAHSIPHFEPVERWWQWTVEFGPDTGRTYSGWRWRCTKLGADGRCTIYEDRPDLCRHYEPLEDFLCIMRKGERS